MTNITVTPSYTEFEDAISHELYKIAGVSDCKVIVNNKLTTCPYTELPPMSMKVVVIVVDGKVRKKKIAKVLWKYKPLGISLIGSTSKTVEDTSGYRHNIHFEVVNKND